ncbi:MAG: ISAzo13 family transposase, partial [Paraclostridium sp.]
MAIASIVNQLEKVNLSKLSKILGVSRTTIRKAISEYKNDSFNHRVCDRGRKSTIAKLPNIEKDIADIVNSQSQTDPTFNSTRIYTRLTVSKIREKLIAMDYCDNDLPSNETIRKIVNLLGFTLRKVRKTQPIKKVPETDYIFENLNNLHEQADLDDDTVRISVDAKDKVKIGNFSRGGYSRTVTSAFDHDFSTEYITPLGILDIKKNKVDMTFTRSKITADFIVDCIEKYWLDNYYNTDKDTLIINLDNGPENNSRRSQFLKRIADFSVDYDVKVILAYYPPYHSKYNPVERVWGILENHWNGSILDTKETILRFAQSMTYKGLKPTVNLSKNIYECGK